jgi:hypothetical protein
MDLIDYPCEMGSGVECCTRVDLPAIDPPAEPTAGPERAIVIGPELLRAGSRLFLEARDSLENSSSPASWDTYGGIANAASRARRYSHVGWRHGTLDQNSRTKHVGSPQRRSRSRS